MSIRVRVNHALFLWCGEAPDDQETTIANLWEDTRNGHVPHNGIDLSPDGLDDLRRKLDHEFLSNPPKKDTSALSNASFKPGGDIDTVDDLVQAVIDCDNA